MRQPQNLKLPKFDLSSYAQPIIGVDEVGRGCLAGPVTAAAVILKSDQDCDLYTDSKLLSPSQRSVLAQSVSSKHWVCLGWASVAEVDSLNILKASLLAMKRAIEGLSHLVGGLSGSATILIDGRDIIPGLEHFRQFPVIKGDLRVSAISAASIAAKVARDQFMVSLAGTKAGAGYGFEQHKGYGTAVHRRQIQKLGPGPWHRQSFSGVREHLKENLK